MPDRDTHRKISKLLLGDDCNATHAAIDYPYRFLGRKHRILLHDPLSAALVGYFMDGYKGVASALLHLAEDKYLKPRYAKRLMEGIRLIERTAERTAEAAGEIVRTYKLGK